MDKTLKETFFESLEAFDAIETAKKPINSAEVQQKIKRTIEMFEQCTEQVSEIDLFAANEHIDELETSTIPFFLLPALLGTLTLKLCDCEREHVVNVAEIYFRDFLKRCAHYGLCDYESKRDEEAGPVARRTTTAAPSMAQMAHCRQTKIARFKEKKQLQESLKSLKHLMDSKKDHDEQIEREYYLNMVKTYIHQAIEDLESIEMEKPLIEFRRNQRKSNVSDGGGDDDDDGNEDREDLRIQQRSVESRNMNEFAKKNSLNAIIIARNRAEKLVFGAGYPSLPVMSVEEFYEKRVRDGIFPGAGCQSNAAGTSGNGSKAPLSAEDEKIIEEAKLENDDAEMIAKLRLQDDYRDNHRRGWGNRYNRS